MGDVIHSVVGLIPRTWQCREIKTQLSRRRQMVCLHPHDASGFLSFWVSLRSGEPAADQQSRIKTVQYGEQGKFNS